MEHLQNMYRASKYLDAAVFIFSESERVPLLQKERQDPDPEDLLTLPAYSSLPVRHKLPVRLCPTIATYSESLINTFGS
jgi:hypothetical protein